MFDLALARPEIKFNDATAIAQSLLQVGNYAKLEGALKKRADLAPNQPEARFDLAALQTVLGRANEALDNLRLAVADNSRQRATNPAAPDLAAVARTDPRFAAIRNLPEFQKIVPPQ